MLRARPRGVGSIPLPFPQPPSTQPLLTPSCRPEARGFTSSSYSLCQPQVLGAVPCEQPLPPAVLGSSCGPALGPAGSSGWQPWRCLGRGGTSLPGDGPEGTAEVNGRSWRAGEQGTAGRCGAATYPHEAVVQPDRLLGICQGLPEPAQHHQGGSSVPIVAGIVGTGVCRGSTHG